jgi:predicted  nucleic acid-binding Zn-ribbon protein
LFNLAIALSYDAVHIHSNQKFCNGCVQIAKHQQQNAHQQQDNNRLTEERQALSTQLSQLRRKLSSLEVQSEEAAANLDAGGHPFLQYRAVILVLALDGMSTNMC